MTEYYQVRPSTTDYYKVLEYYQVLLSNTEYYRVQSSTTEYYRGLPSTTEYCRVIQNTKEYYRVLAGRLRLNLLASSSIPLRLPVDNLQQPVIHLARSAAFPERFPGYTSSLPDTATSLYHPDTDHIPYQQPL